MSDNRWQEFSDEDIAALADLASIADEELALSWRVEVLSAQIKAESDRRSARSDRWESFSYDEMQVISAALPRDVLRVTDVSRALQHELERAKFERRAEVLSAQIKAERDKRAARLDRWDAFTLNELRDLAAGQSERSADRSLPREERHRVERLIEEINQAIDSHAMQTADQIGAKEAAGEAERARRLNEEMT
jgi:hypothetical protein